MESYTRKVELIHSRRVTGLDGGLKLWENFAFKLRSEKWKDKIKAEVREMFVHVCSIMKTLKQYN